VFFDFGDHIKANATGYFPYTPSLPMLYGLRESLNMLFEERLHRVFERHQVLADGVRAAVKAWGLRLCAKEPKWYSNTVSAIMVPPGIDGADVIDSAFRRYNLALGAGLSKVAGKLFRFGHLGDLNDLMVLGALAGAEMAMRDVGIDIAMGSGVAAAQAHFRKTIMAKEKLPTEEERRRDIGGSSCHRPSRSANEAPVQDRKPMFSSEHTICAVDPEVWQAIRPRISGSTNILSSSPRRTMPVPW
jgi:alanine-glyoxylate transaminase/serine-glyoxylate transaminase/serine-pyruvate transaminase